MLRKTLGLHPVSLRTLGMRVVKVVVIIDRHRHMYRMLPLQIHRRRRRRRRQPGQQRHPPEDT
ncbi:hypothetical protein DPMN_009921 [Dreissena polymorpha]|uniref:Uncharacterized protein n=1 Tax=Dreissena polymorpha TaxID=45954 RepID=A0A9D4N276_DREPO|nr:hypothetical protein DPMN_009921 [Dreissena polymorpha]